MAINNLIAMGAMDDSVSNPCCVAMVTQQLLY